MNKEQFIEYVKINFTVSEEYLRLLDNVLSYAEGIEYDKQFQFLCDMLDCTIGLSMNEIAAINL